MKKHLKNPYILGSLSLLIIVLTFAITFFVVRAKQSPVNTAPENKALETAENQPADPSLPIEFTESAWIPDWAGRQGLESFKANKDRFGSISPVWYEVNKDGSLKNKIPSNAGEITSTAVAAGIPIIPAIAMFDHELFTEVLQSQENLERHVSSIISEVEQKNYAGIDLDYESTKLSDKDKFFEFLGKLSTRFKANDKVLIVTVIGQWEDNNGYKSLKETRQVQDWTEINKYADFIRIMTYDYTPMQALYPGPIAPLDWMAQVLDYAVKKLPREKIILGIHLYSYEWWVEAKEIDDARKVDGYQDPIAFQKSSDLNLPINKKPTRSYTYDTVKELVENFAGELTDYQGEKVFRFRKQNPQTKKLEERHLVFIDPAGVQARIDLAKEYNIAGVVYWRLGGEGELLAD